MAIVHKHGLICTAFFRADMVTDHLNEEGDRALDLFVGRYAAHISAGKTNQALFEGFDAQMWELIVDYLIRIGVFPQNMPAFLREPVAEGGFNPH